MLIVKSTFSLNSAASDRLTTEPPENLPKLAKKAGWPAVALIDERTMAGTVKFLSAARKEGLKATVGIQASRLRAKGGTMTVMLMPLTQPGLSRLLQATKAVAAAQSLTNVIDALPEHPGPYDLMAFLMPAADYVASEEEGPALRAAFKAHGVNCAVALLTMNGEEMRHAPQDACTAFAKRDLPIVRLAAGATKAKLDETLTTALVQFSADCINARDLPAREREPQAFANTAIPEAAGLLAETDQASLNARSVFERIGELTASRRPDLPRRLGLGATEDADTLLREQARAGLAAKIASGRIIDPDAARERLEYELETMINLKFSNYFLIMAEAIRYARENGIYVGPGRGSAAGSMVIYALGITNIDPLKHKLLFERFINPERVSLPDIDTDFCPERRNEVFEHLVALYGDDHVAQIATYGSLQPKGAVRKAATLLKVPQIGNRAVAAMSARSDDDELVKFEQLHKSDDPEIASVGRLAKFLHGLASNSGVHAGGLILSDDPIGDWAPLSPQRTDEGLNVVQYDMKATEDAGFVKFDFLGLRTLTIIDETLRTLRRTGVDIDMDTIEMEDPSVYEMLRRGRTLTVFQLEGGAITKAGREIGITCFEDIVALVALYRPGPMHNIPLYANRKHGRAPVEYLHPVLEPVLSDTFGIIIYQEQIMQMARDFAGYSMPEADQLRRAIGKKIKADVEAEREPFVRKAVEMGRDKDLAEELFEFVLPFAQYGFNRSHAAAYATVTYQTAWLKKHHPGPWYAACLTHARNPEQAARIVAEAATSAGFAILPPDVNASEKGYSFVTRDGVAGIMLPLECVLGVGQLAASEAIDERTKNGPFKSFTDFTNRVSSLNKSQIENLVWAGAFDCVAKAPPTVARPHFADLAQTTTIMSPQKRKEAVDQIGLFAATEPQDVEDPAPRVKPLDPEAVSNRQNTALQNLLYHERRTIASSAWRRELEALPMIAKAATLARSINCNTMGILRKQDDRMVPQRDGSLQRVIQVTLEDESGTHRFDLARDFVMGQSLIEAKDRCVKITLGAGQGFAFISNAPEIKHIEVFPDPLAEPRQYPAIVVQQELDDALRNEMRTILREVAIKGHDVPGATAAAKATRRKKGDKLKPRASHVLIVPPSRQIEIMPLPGDLDRVDLRDVMDSLPSVVSVLD